MTKYMAIGMVVMVALLAVAGFLLKRAYAENGALEIKLSNAQAIIDQREKDAKANAIAVAQLADKVARTEAKVITTERVIYAAPRTTVCADVAPIRAATGSLPDLYASPVPAGDRAQPAAGVPAPAAAASAVQR